VTHPKNIMHPSNTNPHIRDKYSPLNTLAMQALRRFGDFSPGTVDGEVMLMFIEFGNMVIDDIRSHPYWDGNEIDYYASQTDAREIPDIVVVNGLLNQYAQQQGSEKMQMYMPTYYTTLNRELWQVLNGNTKIRARIVDGGTNKRNVDGQKTNVLNGLVTDGWASQ
jgi:hypothetical protein